MEGGLVDLSPYLCSRIVIRSINKGIVGIVSPKVIVIIKVGIPHLIATAPYRFATVDNRYGICYSPAISSLHRWSKNNRHTGNHFTVFIWFNGQTIHFAKALQSLHRNLECRRIIYVLIIMYAYIINKVIACYIKFTFI